VGRVILFLAAAMMLSLIWQLRRAEVRLPGARRWALTAAAVVVGAVASGGVDLESMATTIAIALFIAWVAEFFMVERERFTSDRHFFRSSLRDFILFARKMLLALLFPIAIFAVLAFTHYLRFPILGLGRYDCVLILCIAIQVALVRLKIESIDEAIAITWFHLLGLGLELFKVHVGSWSYPEPAWTKFFGVPLYSGFMYASVASFLMHVWRKLDMTLEDWPQPWAVALLGGAIYLNFFTHHFIADLRWLLIFGICFIFFRIKVTLINTDKRRVFPLVGLFFGLGLFIWIGENVATFLGAWAYPDQMHGWSMVHLAKIQSWFLLGIISFMLVAQLKRRSKS
jgi:uncharacterized membrane protein YoaT (DUF817 family)